MGERPPYCPCGWDLFSADDVQCFSSGWHEAHKAHHLAMFPEIAEQDPGTVRNLDEFIATAARAEGRLL